MRFFYFLSFSLCCLLAASVANAKSDTLHIPPKTSVSYDMPKQAYRVKVGNNSVAEVKKISNSEIEIWGKKSGRTELSFVTKNGELVEKVTVEVGKGSKGPSSGLGNTINQLFPNQNISVRHINDNLILTGSVSDAEIAGRVEQLARSGRGPEQVINLLQVTSGQQVMLRVRIGEVQRGSLTQLGLGLGGLSGGFQQSQMFDISSTLEFLERNGVMKVLAEPNLTAISGETAKFLAGGEFPIPVMQNGNAVTVEYKPFGVGVEFTPLVLSQNRIRLTVEPEVSEISTHGAVGNINGMKIPAISARRAKTTVELAPGESFVIAGLIKDDMRNVVDEMPGLNNIPILSALFRSSAFRRNETELVIAVTPYLVDPVASRDIKLPTDDFRPATALENYFFGALGSMGNRREVLSKTPGYGYEGSYGYIAN